MTKEYMDLLFDRSEDGLIGTITLNRPQALNALSMRLSDEFVSAIDEVSRDEKMRILIIKGAGGTFCVGDDIKEMPAWGNPNQIARRIRYYQRMAYSLEELEQVTIAAVQGYAVGGGLEITMACDFVIATEGSFWGMPEVDSGITPGWGGTTRLPRLIGRRLSKEVNMLGELLPARRAVEAGLWNRVVPDDKLFAEVDRLSELIKSKNQQILRQLKFIINKNVEADLYTAQAFEVLSGALTGAVAWDSPEVEDAERGKGLEAFRTKNELWQTRRALAKEWTDR